MAPAKEKMKEKGKDMRSLSTAQTAQRKKKLAFHFNVFLILMSLHCSSSRMGRYMKLQEL